MRLVFPSIPVLTSLLLLLGIVAVSHATAQGAALPPPDLREYEARVAPLLKSHCVGCHNAEKAEGGIDLSRLGPPAEAARRRGVWRRAAARVAAGEMPPRGAKGLSRRDRTRMVRWMQSAAEHLDPNDPTARDPGPSVLRRLTRTEYDRTVRDLFGISFDSGREVGLPGSEGATRFDNQAAALTLSPALLDKYLAAAEKVTEHVFDDPRARKRLLVPEPEAGVPEREAARRILVPLLRRAYRRPATPTEVDRFLKVYDTATHGAQGGGDLETGMRAVLKPVLISPHFLYRIEQDRPGAGPQRVSDHELAVRLSYFLWSAPPDDALAALADAGRLSDPEVLEAQVRRMLAHPQARALTDGFGIQWLQLDELSRARPSTEFFPSFTRRLRQAMYDETATFFDRLRTEDRSVLELLDADYTYANAELAAHYGIEGITGRDLQRVTLRPEHRRGGLLGMGSVLALTSHTHRTSPTLRGKYILDVIFGTPPPPPPPDAGLLKEEKGKEPRSFREQLALHASNASCVGCHRKLDPLGFALENYDAVGAWRETSPERPLDTTGELPTGEKLRGAADLKQVLLKRKGEFVRNLAGQLLSYALGRELEDQDEHTLRRLTADLERDGYRFSTLVVGITRSPQFLYRRGKP